MKKTLTGALALLAGVVFAGTAEAQLPFTVEARAGVAVPTGEFGDAAENGLGYGASLSYLAAPRASVYAGYSQAEFNADDSDAEAMDSGWEFGARIAFPGVGFSPFIRGGVLVHEYEVESGAVEVEGDSELGFEVGAGAAFPLGPRVSVTPGVSYRRYSTEFPIVGEQEISYLNLDVGLRIRL
ncbi:MAG TPA: outer membrane beta-barrel protein [Longimicrobiaceae bacterium]|nr:outer membrane beta-barrel protein [Longimicrobiaceae bacterium]